MNANTEDFLTKAPVFDIASLKSILNLVTGGISLLACVWIFHFYSKTFKPRPVSLKLILALSIADFFFSLANIISVFDVTVPALCTFEALMRLFSVMSGLYWASCIAILTRQTFMKGRDFDQQAFYKKTVILGIVIPTLFSILPLFTDGYYSYGVQTFGCYVKLGDPAQATHAAKFLLMMIFDGLPVIVALTIAIAVYAQVVKKVNDLTESLLIATDLEIRRLFWYPAALFLAYIPSFIDNIIELYIASASESNIFTTVHIILTHSIGLTNALVYGLQRKNYYDNYEKPRAVSQTASTMFSAHPDGDDNGNNEGSEGDEYSDDYGDEIKVTKVRRGSDYDELLQASSAHLL